MFKKITSNKVYILLVLILALSAGITVYLPAYIQTEYPAPKYVVALISMATILIFYGGLGYLGLHLSRKLGFADILDPKISNRQRFLIPGLIGAGCGLLIMLGDSIFKNFNGIGSFPHPPFPTSITATITAGIGEEIIFRLFFISFWTWMISSVILRKRWLNQIFWIVSVISAIAFAMGHMPAIMVLYNFANFNQVPGMLLFEMILLNGVLSLFAAYYFRKYGFLAAVGIHFWADVVWHIFWGLTK